MGSRARPKMSDVDEQRAFFVSRKAKAKADVRKGKSWEKSEWKSKQQKEKNWAAGHV